MTSHFLSKLMHGCARAEFSVSCLQEAGMANCWHVLAVLFTWLTAVPTNDSHGYTYIYSDMKSILVGHKGLARYVLPPQSRLKLSICMLQGSH